MVALHASPHISVGMSAQGLVQRNTLARRCCVVDMADHAPPDPRILEREDLVKYRRGLARARVRVLKNIMWCTTTTDEEKIMLTEARVQNFAEEDETLKQIERKLINWPAHGTPEESARLEEIKSLWLQVVMTKALFYDLEGVDNPTPSTASTV